MGTITFDKEDVVIRVSGPDINKMSDALDALQEFMDSDE